MRPGPRPLVWLFALACAAAPAVSAAAAPETAPASAPASAPATLPFSPDPPETAPPAPASLAARAAYRPYLIASISPALLFDAFEGRVSVHNFLAARIALLVHRHFALAFTRLWAPVATRTTVGAYMGGFRAVVGPYPPNLQGTLEAGFIFAREASGGGAPRINTTGGGGAVDESVGVYVTAGLAWRFHRLFSAYTDTTLTFVRFPTEDLSFGWLGFMVTSGVAFTLGVTRPVAAAVAPAAADAPRAGRRAFKPPLLVFSAGPAVMGDVTPTHGAWLLPLVSLRVAVPYTTLGGPAVGAYWGPIAARAPAPIAQGQHLTALAFTLGWRFARPLSGRLVATLEGGALLALVRNAVDGDRDSMGRLLWQSLDRTTHVGFYGGAGLAVRIDPRFSIYADAQLTATVVPIDDGRFGRYGAILAAGLALTL